MDLNIDFVRKQFPALSGDWVFMDNAGGSQTLQSVIDRISEYLLTSDVQLGASYKISQVAGERVAKAAQSMAELIHAQKPSEIVMGSSTSLLIRILSLCLSQTFQPSDEIVVTNCDHEANIGAWRDLETKGFEIKEWKINRDSLSLELEDLKALITKKTRLVAVTHVSNILGTINPVKEIATMVHDHNALICVDGVAHAPHRLIDVREWDVDFYAFSFYKVYGPHYALLYGKEPLLLDMPGVNHFFIKQTDLPLKFQPGNVNFELSYGMMGFCDYLSEFARIHGVDSKGSDLRQNASRAFQIIKKYEQILSARLLDFLNSKPRVRIIGEKTSSGNARVPTISFVVDKLMSDSITEKVDKHKIGIRYGHFYAKRLIDALDLDKKNGVVRVSMVHYNTLEEVDRLIQVLDRIF
ncbi:MAG: cysteine desulfurase-like protein [Candidatus Aminicenantes bacterium]|nr:cysteine desulfurase-like protein [Candidatus Aminicenantes bacterium]